MQAIYNFRVCFTFLDNFAQMNEWMNAYIAIHWNVNFCSILFFSFFQPTLQCFSLYSYWMLNLLLPIPINVYIIGWNKRNCAYQPPLIVVTLTWKHSWFADKWNRHIGEKKTDVQAARKTIVQSIKIRTLLNDIVADYQNCHKI